MPQFAPSEIKTARAPTTISPSGLSCEAELFLGPDAMTKVATSGRVPFTSTGASQDVRLPVTMPATQGTYHVYLDVYAEGSLIAAYQAVEDVVIAIVGGPPPTPPPSMPTTAGIYGKVTDVKTGQPISGANIFVASLAGLGTLQSKTDGYGNYAISSIDPGWYDIDIEKLGYEPASWRNIYLSETEVGRFDAQLTPKPLYTLKGTVTHSITGSPVGTVIVRVYDYETNNQIERGETDSQGYYSITNIEVRKVNVKFAKEGYVTSIYKSIVLSKTLNHEMEPVSW